MENTDIRNVVQMARKVMQKSDAQILTSYYKIRAQSPKVSENTRWECIKAELNGLILSSEIVSREEKVEEMCNMKIETLPLVHWTLYYKYKAIDCSK